MSDKVSGGVDSVEMNRGASSKVIVPLDREDAEKYVSDCGKQTSAAMRFPLLEATRAALDRDPDERVVLLTNEEIAARLNDNSLLGDMLHARIEGDIYPEFVRVHDSARAKLRAALTGKEEA